MSELNLSDVFYCDRIDELETLVAQQAAVIEKMREALTVSEEFINRHSEDWYVSGQSDLKQVRAAIALQPCPEVLNKVRADAVQEAANFIEPNVGRIFVLDEYIRRIKQGEV